MWLQLEEIKSDSASYFVEEEVPFAFPSLLLTGGGTNAKYSKAGVGWRGESCIAALYCLRYSLGFPLHSSQFTYFVYFYSRIFIPL